MKKTPFLYILSGFLVFTSCEKELDQKPLSDASTETFYAIPNDFIQGVNAVYANLRPFPDRLLNLSETRSDNLYAVSDGGVRDWEGINSFHKTIASNPYVTEAWAGNFNGIFKANAVLEQLQKNGGIVTNSNLRTRLEAEARFLRAFFYFDLVRWFGKVPIIDRPVTASEALNIPRSSVAEVYELIISDLKYADENLPPQYATVADKGRVTKYAAKGILALVHMTRSGPTYGIEGPGLGLNEWGQALTLLNQIIADNKYSFITNGANQTSAYSSIFSYTNENNSEVIFDVQYITGSNPVLGSTFAWLLAPDTWFQSLGKNVQGGLTVRPVSQDLLNSYAPGDVRKAFSIQQGYTHNGTVYPDAFFKKYIDITKVPTNRVDWPINFIVLRYTDVLMLKAECILNGAPGTQTEVDNIVNQVRSRAGLGPISNVTMAQLMEERRKEFAAEGLRWHDLVRSGLVITKIPSWIQTEDTLGQMQAFIKEYILYPVPQSQLDVKPGLYIQNDEY